MDYKRSLKRRHVSPTKRLFSTIVIEEDGADTKTVVPSHWVDPCKSIVFYPPRGRKTVAVYLSEWAEPEVGWQEFKLIEYILEAGSYETCHAMLMFQTEDKDDDVPISKKFEIIVKERVASPKLKLGGIKIKFQYLDEHDDVSISKKFEIINKERLASPKHKLGGIKTEFQYLDEHDDVPLSKKFEIIDKERLASPKHKLGGIKTEFQYLDKHDDVPILKKFEITDKERLASPKHKLGGIETEFQYLDEEKVVPSSNKFEVKEREKVDSFLDPVASTPSKMIDDDNRDSCKCVEKLRKIGDGGVSFKEMPNKQFQYALFMDIQKNFRQIQDTQAQILDRLKNIEQSGDVDFSLNVDDIEKEPISSIERFDIIENMLKTSTNARKRKKSLLVTKLGTMQAASKVPLATY
nr:uncharacterized protein LOC124807853 isoform X4 [Hydra vulgaris]